MERGRSTVVLENFEPKVGGGGYPQPKIAVLEPNLPLSISNLPGFISYFPVPFLSPPSSLFRISRLPASLSSPCLCLFTSFSLAPPLQPHGDNWLLLFFVDNQKGDTTREWERRQRQNKGLKLSERGASLHSLRELLAYFSLQEVTVYDRPSLSGRANLLG